MPPTPTPPTPTPTPQAAPAGSSPASLAKAGARFLKKLVFDESTIEPDNRRTDDRVPVAGEVTIVALGPDGQPVGQARVFVRDLSKGGCGLWSRVGFGAGTRLVVRFPGVNNGPPTQRIVEVCHCRGAATTGFALGCRFLEENEANAA
jgi:hypothetical protein